MYKKLYACTHIGEADIIVSLLKRNGFNPSEFYTSCLPGILDDEQYYYVKILEEEYPQAKDFLARQGFPNSV